MFAMRVEMRGGTVLGYLKRFSGKYLHVVEYDWSLSSQELQKIETNQFMVSELNLRLTHSLDMRPMNLSPKRFATS